jgi:hypothetical protein
MRKRNCGRKAGKGKREVMRDNQCNSETNKQKNGFWECQVPPGVRPEKGHLSQRLK